MKKTIAIAAGALLLAPSAALAAGSDGPTPYTVDASGITLPRPLQDNDHINIRTTSGQSANIHAEGKCATRTDAECAGKRHEVAKLIGQKHIPWTVFGVGEPCVEWVQVAGYNEHYGEGGQSAAGPGCQTTPEPEPEPLPDPQVQRDYGPAICVEDGIREYHVYERSRGAYRGDDGKIYWGNWSDWQKVETKREPHERCDKPTEPEPTPEPTEPTPTDPEPTPEPEPTEPEPADSEPSHGATEPTPRPATEAPVDQRAASGEQGPKKSAEKPTANLPNTGAGWKLLASGAVAVALVAAGITAGVRAQKGSSDD